MLAISIIAALGTGIKTMMLALCITSTPAFIRIVRAQVLTIKDQEYVEAARSIGAGNLRIMTKHILPNALAPIIVQYTLGAVNLILWAASLSFLGMGVQPPTPEWGLMVSAGESVPVQRVVYVADSRVSHHHHDVCPQSAGRRSAGRAGPAAETLRGRGNLWKRIC